MTVSNLDGPVTSVVREYGDRLNAFDLERRAQLAVALRLAEQIDSADTPPYSVAGLARELRASLADLRDDSREPEPDAVAEVISRRARRRGVEAVDASAA